jgi:hypothetical protein
LSDASSEWRLLQPGLIRILVVMRGRPHLARCRPFDRVTEELPTGQKYGRSNVLIWTTAVVTTSASSIAAALSKGGYARPEPTIQRLLIYEERAPDIDAAIVMPDRLSASQSHNSEQQQGEV